MKTKIFLVSIISLFIFGSCVKDGQKVYSCDDEINKYVTQNEDELVNIPYEEIISFDLEYQKAIFRAMAPAKRYEMWQTKIKWVLSNSTLSSNEERHLENLINSMKVSWFDEAEIANEDFAEKLDDYLINWVVYSINELGWIERTTFSIVVRLGKDNIPIDNLKNASSQRSNDKGEGSYKDTPSGGACQCSTTSDWCDFGGGGTGACVEDSYNCNRTSLGCGTLWSYECDGLCELGAPGGGGTGK
ncbi:MAG: bacteriocin fulvocin C-related protein [Bacteroidales bacterium]|nr:bacteriocin fulvocin C-related protein [Bacteroidales bacterium]